VNSGEYKLMGLAPYGEPRYADRIYEHLMDLKEDGSFRLDMSYFNYCQGLTMTSKSFDALFDGPPRQPESPLEHKQMDLAASIQHVTEEVMLRRARKLLGARRSTIGNTIKLSKQGLRSSRRSPVVAAIQTPPHQTHPTRGRWRRGAGGRVDRSPRVRCRARCLLGGAARNRSRRR